MFGSFVDILVVALVGAVIVSRFTKFKLPKAPKLPQPNDWRSLLRGPSPQQSVQVPPTPKATPKNAPSAKPKPTAKELAAMDGLSQIKALDDTFSETVLLKQAKESHASVYKHLAKGTLQELSTLCGPSLLKSLAKWPQAEAHATFKAGSLTATLQSGRVTGKTAVVTLLFSSTAQLKKGPAHPRKELWTLARPLGDTNPTWEVQSITLQEGKA